VTYQELLQSLPTDIGVKLDAELSFEEVASMVDTHQKLMADSKPATVEAAAWAGADAENAARPEPRQAQAFSFEPGARPATNRAQQPLPNVGGSQQSPQQRLRPVLTVSLEHFKSDFNHTVRSIATFVSCLVGTTCTIVRGRVAGAADSAQLQPSLFERCVVDRSQIHDVSSGSFSGKVCGYHFY
jgi:hypothetical protein